MSNLIKNPKQTNLKIIDVVLGADDNGCMINIDPTVFGGNTNDILYLDVNYQRPLNWTPAETINNPTEGFSNIQVSTGKLNDPFTSYEEMLAYMLGNTGTRLQPRYFDKEVRVLSDMSTSLNMEYNGM